jgi:uncharacterized protein
MGRIAAKSKGKVAKKTAIRVRHIPQRTCVGCHQVLEKKALIRLVRTSEGIVIDPGGKIAGRGAYLHELRQCWEKGLKGSLANALKIELTETDRNSLRTYLENLPDDSKNNGSDSGTDD